MELLSKVASVPGTTVSRVSRFPPINALVEMVGVDGVLGGEGVGALHVDLFVRLVVVVRLRLVDVIDDEPRRVKSRVEADRRRFSTRKYCWPSSPWVRAGGDRVRLDGRKAERLVLMVEVEASQVSLAQAVM
jgi:hypothetical protein